MFWAPPVIWAAFIFYLSHRTSAELPDVSWAPPGTDKLAHGVMFGVLGALLAGAFAGASPLRGREKGRGRIIGAAIALGLAYAGLDELHQAFVPTRMPDLFDLAADAAGLALGAWLAFDYLIQPRLPLPNSKTHIHH